jgi:dipeptidyl aminopeptidase/acylaminoacyl peptidase
MALFRGGLAFAFIFAAGAGLQGRSAPSYASQLAQLVAATQTPVAAQASELLFIASGGDTLPALTRLPPSALSDVLSLNRAAESNALMPVGQAAALPAGCEASGMHAAPRGPWVAIELACGHGEVSLLRVSEAQTGASKPLGANFGSQVVFLGWSPNGQHVIVLKDALSGAGASSACAGEARSASLSPHCGAGAALVSVADGAVTNLNVPGDVYNIALSHDGTRMAYSLTRGLGFGSETWIASIDGSNPRLLSADPKHIVAYARFSPDDGRIAFIRMPDSNVPFTVGELWTMSADGSGQRLLGQADAGHGYAPAWSPDGGRIAYVFRENGGNVMADQVADQLSSNIHIADAQTGTVQAATSFANTLVEAPTWSPDGAQLAFAALPSGGGVSDVWLYAPANSAVIRATQSANTRYPVFTSDR